MARIDAFVLLDVPARTNMEKTPIGTRLANDGTFTHVEEHSLMGAAGFKDGDRVLMWRELLRTANPAEDDLFS